jgi:peroxiredoxin family protein
MLQLIEKVEQLCKQDERNDYDTFLQCIQDALEDPNQEQIQKETLSGNSNPTTESTTDHIPDFTAIPTIRPTSRCSQPIPRTNPSDVNPYRVPLIEYESITINDTMMETKVEKIEQKYLQHLFKEEEEEMDVPVLDITRIARLPKLQ